ncbi:putative RNA polymerase sigma-54 factor [Roseibium sp. TrichSKD4]|uniref:hypothetical protein n=1 Tax=Roseibium sp. TrichSKD4 TaxID=744980 RepID=UPI0001E56840|nr:hypothetical protein [Roseibium sp. TrichSKD4]EFO31271.1 putative RNA polymerase sigma-54 factor [Roseibium sp. TrichSKD4]
MTDTHLKHIDTTAASDETGDLANARTILAALCVVLGEDGQKPVSRQQLVNELVHGPSSLRKWFKALLAEAENEDPIHLRTVNALQKALELTQSEFRKACEAAIAIVA